MDSPLQKYALTIGRYGCYFLCLIKIAERKTGNSIDLLSAFEYSLKQGWITEDCFVNYPQCIIKHFTNINYVCVVKELDLSYKPKATDVLVGCYVYNKSSHFVLLSSDKKLLWDPLGESNTYKLGKLDSYRVIRMVV